jgi:hypothetical protein
MNTLQDSFSVEIESDEPMSASLSVDRHGNVSAYSYCDRCGSAHDGVTIPIDKLIKLFNDFKEAN